MNSSVNPVRNKIGNISAPCWKTPCTNLAKKTASPSCSGFFQNKSLKEVGLALGLSENAARMRVERALDKLRARLARKGVTSTSAALALLLAGNAVTATPAGFVATLTSASFASATLGTGITLTLL